MSEALHPNQLRPGDHVREYRLVRRLGKGGFSQVFLAEHGGQSFALKVALQPASEEDEEHLDGWMRREALSLEHFTHPNLLPVHELGRWPRPRTGYSFFVTDYVPGLNFREWCQSKPLTPTQWVAVLSEVLRPLEALHERGMCHRDLKSENILVREGDERPFLIDFGAVHLPCARPLTQGLAPGTLYCQPPEAVRFVLGKEVLEPGARFEARPSADLYAVGILLYEALTGHHPFDPKLPVEQLLVAILTVAPTDPRRLNPRAPDSLCELTLRLLAKEPEQRPASVRVVREELERLRREEGQTPAWKTPSVLVTEETGSAKDENAPKIGTQGQGEVPPDRSAPIGRTGSRTRVLLAWGIGLGLLGLVGWGLLRRVESTAPAVPVPLESGARPVQPRQTAEPVSPRDTARGCSLLQVLLGMTVAPLLGCATTPAVRPDPIGHLQRCSPEARATPGRLGFDSSGPTPYLYGSHILGGTSASSQGGFVGGALNLKPGPIEIDIQPFDDATTVHAKGVATTTRMRVYIQIDQIQGRDGKWWPVCGAAVSTAEDVYGIPTREAVQFPDCPVDPAKVDHSPGSVVINDPQFMTFIEPPLGARRAKVEVADPDAKADIHF